MRLRLVWLTVVVCVFLLICILVWFVPHLFLRGDLWALDSLNLTQQQSQFATPSVLDDYRKTFLQLLGGFVLVVGLWYTKRNVDITLQGRLTDRMSKAVEHLGARDGKGQKLTEIRLGGIMELDRLAMDSKVDEFPILEILAAYCRSTSPVSQAQAESDKGSGQIRSWVESLFPPQKDPVNRDTEDVHAAIRAALKINRRRPKTAKVGRVNFLNLRANSIDLSGHCLANTDFQNGSLRASNLCHADLSGAAFSNTDLDEVEMRFATSHAKTAFDGAKLMMANFSDSELKGADFNTAQAEGAQFLRARLRGATFDHARLAGANFTGADLSKCSFRSAQIKDAIFSKCILQGADFADVDVTEAIDLEIP